MIKKEKINVFKDSEELSKGFTTFLLKLLEVYPHINISLSGGSTPKVIFDYWAENCKTSIPWEKISFFWGDERCVPPEDDMNNFGMTKEHLFDKVPDINPKSLCRIHGENEPDEETVRYADKLRRKVLQRKDIPCFEIVMLGLGDDGHTVSIFPHEIDLWESQENCVIGTHPESGMKRVSITGRVVNNAQYIVFLATGKSKADKVRDIIKNRKDFMNQYPAARVKPKYGYLYWFLDEEAASLI